uniref:Uncharacterized protein n=1 Tax=Glossina austeni TaxID=7395 RepID=A0A1A9UJU7_GLOAU
MYSMGGFRRPLLLSTFYDSSSCWFLVAVGSIQKFAPNRFMSLCPYCNVIMWTAAMCSQYTTEEIGPIDGGLYDIYKERLSDLQDNYANSMEELMRDNSKRSLKGKSGNLYEEFKKRLDRFNGALAISLESKGDKRAVPSSSLYDKFKRRLNAANALPPGDDNDELGDDFLNRQGRGFFNYFGKKFGKDHISAKSKEKNFESSKDFKESMPVENGHTTILDNRVNPFDEIPGSIYDRYRQQLNEWSGGAIFNREPRSEKSLQNVEPFFIWQDADKDMGKMDDYSVENFIAKCKYENQKLKAMNIKKRRDIEDVRRLQNARDRLRSKRDIELGIPYGTNQWSLYPKVFNTSPQLRVFDKSSSKFLKDYAQKLNTTATELAKNILKVNSTYITEKLEAAQKNKRPSITGSPDSFDLTDVSLPVLQNMIKKNPTHDSLRTPSIPVPPSGSTRILNNFQSILNYLDLED